MPADGSCGSLVVRFARSPDAEEQDSSFLLTPAGKVFPPSYFYLAEVRPEGVRFILSVVPSGAAPPPDGDFVLEETVPAGDYLLEAEVLLTTTHPLSGVAGAQGWSLSVAHHEACMEIESLTLEGVRVSTIFDHDGIPATPPLDPYPLDLKNSQFKVLERGDDRFSVLPPGSRGLVSSIVLHLTKRMTLHLNATDPLLRVVYRIRVPRGGTTECRVAFADGLTGSGSPVRNAITWGGATDCPDLETRGLVVRLTGEEEPPFVRGDANSDGEIDISDASFLLDNLFLGGPRPSCRKTGDLDDNGALEITDPIFLLNFLFLGGPPPRDVYLCRGDPTPDGLGCLSYRCE